MRRGVAAWLLYAVLLLWLTAAYARHPAAPQIHTPRIHRRRGVQPARQQEDSCSSGVPAEQRLARVLALRGGVRKATIPDAAENSELSEDGPKKQGAGTLIKDALMGLKPATRTFLLLVLSCNVLELLMGPLLGIDAKEVLVQSWPHTLFNLELWRPITAALYLGPISMHMATNVYFLVTYGSHLEAVNGTAEQVVFLLTAYICVTLLGALIGLPLVSTCLISACVYASSRVEPLETVPFQFGLRMPRWLLPYGLAAVDFLQAGQAAAAIPHLVGILAGHFYTFNRRTLPLMGGRDWLAAPGWMRRRLDGEDVPNYMEKPAAPKKTVGSSKASKDKAAKAKASKAQAAKAMKAAAADAAKPGDSGEEQED